MFNKGNVSFKQVIDEERRRCYVTAKYHKREFIGVAYCHPEDEFRWRIGLSIAEYRAMIEVLREEIPLAEERVKALHHAYDCLTQKKDYNPNEIAAKALYHAWQQELNDLNAIRAELGITETLLYKYLKKREQSVLLHKYYLKRKEMEEND